jgi:hypothetical protein
MRLLCGLVLAPRASPTPLRSSANHRQVPKLLECEPVTRNRRTGAGITLSSLLSNWHRHSAPYCSLMIVRPRSSDFIFTIEKLTLGIPEGPQNSKKRRLAVQTVASLSFQSFD